MIGQASPSKYPASPIENTFVRTQHAKYASYYGDGFGRDSYISVNNGGLTGNEKANMMRRPHRRTLRCENPNSPRKNPQTTTYKSDGSGRDSYVIHNSGGLVGDYKYFGSDQTFVNNLRGNTAENIPHYPSSLHGPSTVHYKADITTYLNWPSQQARKQGAQNSKVAKNVTSRLSPVRPKQQISRYDLGDAQNNRMYSTISSFTSRNNGVRNGTTNNTRQAVQVMFLRSPRPTIQFDRQDMIASPRAKNCVSMLNSQRGNPPSLLPDLKN